MTRPLVFAVTGALGAMLAALVAAAVLALFPAPVREPVSVVLLLDQSNSMYFYPHAFLPGMSDGDRPRTDRVPAVIDAAKDFVARLDLERDRVGAAGLFGGVNLLAPLGSDARTVRRGIEAIREDPRDATAFSPALAHARGELSGAPGRRFIVLFTDGGPQDLALAAEAATGLREAGIEVVSIGTSDADFAALREVSGSDRFVFRVTDQDFTRAFADAFEVIGSVVGASGSATQAEAVLKAAIFGGLVAAGMAVALVAVQARRLRGRIAARPLSGVAFAALASGAIAGAAGQLVLARFDVAEVGGVAGWIVIGAVVAGLLVFSIPNLRFLPGLLAGAAGGLAGGLVLQAVRGGGEEIVGAVAGAGALGLALGLSLALVERVVRTYWAEVVYAGDEILRVTLGATPVVLGSDSSACTVFVAGSAPRAVSIALDEGRIRIDDLVAGGSRVARPGDEFPVGSARVRLCARSGAAAEDSAMRSSAELAAGPLAAGVSTQTPGMGTGTGTGTGSGALPTPGAGASPSLGTPLPPPLPAAGASPPPPLAAPAAAAMGVPAKAASSEARPPASAPAPPGVPVLRVGDRSIPLVPGGFLHSADIPTLLPTTPFGPVAQVIASPNDPARLGLRNLSAQSWRTIAADGACADVPPGRVMALVPGVRFEFGTLTATLER